MNPVKHHCGLVFEEGPVGDGRERRRTLGKSRFEKRNSEWKEGYVEQSDFLKAICRQVRSAIVPIGFEGAGGLLLSIRRRHRPVAEASLRLSLDRVV